jgi:hypothetical protein
MRINPEIGTNSEINVRISPSVQNPPFDEWFDLNSQELESEIEVQKESESESSSTQLPDPIITKV